MSDFATDTFTDTDGTLLTVHTPELGGPWVVVAGTAGNAQINNNQFISTGGQVLAYIVVTKIADCTVQSNLHYDNGDENYPELSLRMTDAGDTYYSVYVSDIEQTVNLRKCISGTNTELGSAAISFNTPGAVKSISITATGTAISVDFDGTTGVISVTDSSISAAGRVGCGYFAQTGGPSEGIQLNDFHAFVSSGGTFTITDPVPSSITDTTINLSVTTTGGNAPITQQWYRSTSSGFTPGGGNILAGKTALTLSDTTASAGQTYFYKCVATDSSGTPVVLTTNQSMQRLGFQALKVLFIGDSITNGGGGVVVTPPYTLVSQMYPEFYGQYFTPYNAAVNGSKSGDWISGSTNLNAAEVIISANILKTAVVTLGTNDAINGVSDTTYASNMASLVARLIVVGITKIILNYPTGTEPTVGTDAMVDSIISYQPKLDSLLSGTTIVQGDQNATAWLLNNSSTDITNIDAAGTHLTIQGNQVLSDYWTGAINRALNKSTGGGINGSAILGVP